MYDEVIAAALVARRIATVADQGYGAAIINCFMDPGLNAARELATIPVVGAGESAIRVALTVGQRFSIIDVGPMKYILRSPTRQIRSMGLGSRFASIRGIGIPVLKLNEQPDLAVKKIAREAKLAITADGADVIVLGCTGLARLNERIRLRVPIVEPSLSALRMAEMLILLALRRRGPAR
jgi:allantoin racemase